MAQQSQDVSQQVKQPINPNGTCMLKSYQYWQTYDADLVLAEYLLDGKGKLEIIYPLGSSLRGRIIYCIYTELCIFQ